MKNIFLSLRLKEISVMEQYKKEFIEFLFVPWQDASEKPVKLDFTGDWAILQMRVWYCILS